MGFRSLFSWIMLGDPGGNSRSVTRGEFRSLFSWIMLGDKSNYAADAGLGPVSILVLLDHAGRRRDSHCQCQHDRVSILVLLDHAGRLPRQSVQDKARTVFRSLFSWIMLGDWGMGRLAQGSRQVSILVLLDHAGRPLCPRRPDADWRAGFDPCSPGSCWATQCYDVPAEHWGRFRSLFSWIMLGDTDAEADGPITVVSILVLLDHAGRRPANRRRT